VAEFVTAQQALDPSWDTCLFRSHEACKIGDFHMMEGSISHEAESKGDELMQCPCHEWEEIQNPLGSALVETSHNDKHHEQFASLCQLDANGLMELGSPLLMVLGGLEGLRNPCMTKQQRQFILNNQGGLWADDEIYFHLRQIVAESSPEQKLVVFDPLVMASVVRSGCMRPLHEYAKTLEEGATVVACVLVEKHWYPLVLRWDHSGVHAFSCGLAFQFSLALQVIVKEVCKCLKMESPKVKSTQVKFLVNQFCGALAISFIRQLVFGQAFVDTMESLQQEHGVFREQLIQQLPDQCSRPWVWGNGDTWKEKLHSLLQEHGVPLAEVASRAHHVIDRLGEAPVASAMKGPQPWTELKTLSNQVVPMVQLIKPSELQVIIDKRAASGQQVGSKNQKVKSKGKGKGKPSHSLDPALLRVETGVFVCGDQTPLSQISFSRVGPNASGVILTTVEEAMPYLRGGKQISAGGLAFLVVDGGDGSIPTTLIAEKIRFPVICSKNGEPLLIDALMYQLGSFPVTKQVVQDRFQVVSISSCVVKIAVYRDQLSMDWKEFLPHPLKHIFNLVPCLRPCQDEECDGSCEAWHPSPSFRVHDPLLEVWGRQWIKINFAQCNPEEAQCFTIHARLPACLMKQLQSYSGIGGLFLEPKSIDGKTPSQEFHVVWLSKSTLADVQVYKRTIGGIIGLARMGDKLGLRCLTQDAERIHQALKPSSSFLPSGRKLYFLLGPVPFGTLKQSICDAVASIGWQARPVQPVPSSGLTEGLLWKLQAVESPPQNIIVGEHGEMVITRMADPYVHVKPVSSFVGANRTLQMCAAGKSKNDVDPLQANDPWSKYMKSNVDAMPKIAAQDPVKVLEDKVMESVLKRLPKESMEVDSDAGGRDEARFSSLEAKVAALHENQAQLHQMVVKQGENHGQYIDKLAQQQHRLEQAVGEQSSQLTHFQGQFKAQLDQQQGQLDNLFQQQMMRLEELLAKKQRLE